MRGVLRRLVTRRRHQQKESLSRSRARGRGVADKFGCVFLAKGCMALATLAAVAAPVRILAFGDSLTLSKTSETH